MNRPVSDRWKIVHNHYTNIKLQYHLTSSDILRQLGCQQPNIVYLEYLSDNGINREPSTKQGTVGRKLYDILIPGMKKVDWELSTVSYNDKLRELNIDMGYLYITVDIVNEQSCNATPDIIIYLCLDEGPALTKEQLARMFTIDNVIPNVVEINYTRYL